MIRQEFDISYYWRVIVYYNVDYTLFNVIEDELTSANATQSILKRIYYRMKSHKAKAVTFSNINLHISIVLFNRHDTFEDYLDSLVHEAEHVKQAMLYAYRVKDAGEPPAYTVGHIVRRMWRVFKTLLLP